MALPSRKHWPKRPTLDYTKDEFIRIVVGTAPNVETFNVSKIRLAYYSPYFRTSLNFPRNDSQVIELPEICPQIFRHIVQYMNTESIILPDADELNLPTLARIWFLAHYLLIPYIQNIAIAYMYEYVTSLCRPPFTIDEITTTITIASGADTTMVGDKNEVLDLLTEYLACFSHYDHWTTEQRERVPRKVLDNVVGIFMRETSQRRIWPVKYFFVEDIIDDEKATKGLD
ncbi:hypothetical protein NHQ30_006644 [Ciborinia camelliae]|nr:hypothetical protein NHQ30_006644 [Ciborinia camelliae]